MVVVPHGYSQRLANAILRRIAPADPREYLTSVEMESLAPRVKRFDRQAAIVTLTSVAALTALVGSFFWRLKQARNSPTADAVYDDFRQRIVANYCSSLIVAVFLSFVSWYSIFVITWGSEGQRYFRFAATKAGYNVRRAMRWLAIIFFPLGVLIVALVWSSGNWIDANGIRFECEMSIIRQPYSAVRHINLFDQLTALIGVRDVTNLEIAFENGPPFRLLANSGDLTAERLSKIADYVSTKSRVRVERGGRHK
jgi:hypothetical protein